MDTLNELLEKYFSGTTTLEDENKLKFHFQANNVAPEHEIYRLLFDVFNQEKSETMDNSKLKPVQDNRISKRIWIQSFVSTGIAASLVLAFWFQRPQQTENLAVVNGKKYENSEFAEKYAEKKLNKVNEILQRSMKPMQNFDKVRKGLEPMQKLSNVKDKMDEIENKLQFK